MAVADAAKATKQYLPASISASIQAYDVKMYGSTIETWHHVAEKIGLQGWPTHESSGLPEADDYKVFADRLMATVAATGGSPTGQEPTEQPLLKTAKEPQPDEPDELQPAQPVWPDAYLDRAKELVTVEVNRSREDDEDDIPGPSTDLTETGQRKHTAQKLQSARIWTRSVLIGTRMGNHRWQRKANAKLALCAESASGPPDAARFHGSGSLLKRPTNNGTQILEEDTQRNRCDGILLDQRGRQVLPERLQGGRPHHGNEDTATGPLTWRNGSPSECNNRDSDSYRRRPH